MRSSQRASVLALSPARVGPRSHLDITRAAEGLLPCALLPCSVFLIQPLCVGAPKFALLTTSQVKLLRWGGPHFEKHPLRAPSFLHLTWPKDKLKDKWIITGEPACSGTAKPDTHDSSLLPI